MFKNKFFLLFCSIITLLSLAELVPFLNENSTRREGKAYQENMTWEHKRLDWNEQFRGCKKGSASLSIGMTEHGRSHRGCGGVKPPKNRHLCFSRQNWDFSR